MSIVYLNGQYLPAEKASISVMDRGFLFADGVYEVIPVYKGKLFRLAEHLERLNNSLAAIRLPNPHSLSPWDDLLSQLVAKNGAGHLSVYLQVTRGVVAKRDHCYTQALQPTVFAMATSMPIAASEDIARTMGEKAITADDIRWKRCDIKSISLLPNILLKQQAQDAGAAEAILLRSGFVTEGSASNVFIVSNGMLWTPIKDNQLLGGITRDLIIDLVSHAGLSCAEADISEAQLRAADEIWVTSSTKEIVPIIELDNEKVGAGVVGPLWKQVAQLYQQYKQQLMT